MLGGVRWFSSHARSGTRYTARITQGATNTAIRHFSRPAANSRAPARITHGCIEGTAAGQGPTGASSGRDGDRLRGAIEPGRLAKALPRRSHVCGPPRSRERDHPGFGSPASSRARAKTASSIGSVTRPVKVFCWDGW
ncbi:hypothetical protein Acsp03_23960 [Actinomadura sp. NBRC 104412]|nr:hypothetical protein Acsp03_23960 [Actinomadura sp. NBRC 104412]